MKKVVFALFISTILTQFSVANGAPSTTKTKNTTKKATVSYSGKAIVNDSQLCDFAVKNDLLNMKLSFKKHNYSNDQVDMRCKYGNSLLMIAVNAGNYQTTQFLLEHGADVNQQNFANQTPLHILARSTKSNSSDLLDLLLRVRNVDVDIQDTEGYTPLMRAIDFENINAISKLLNAGSNVNIKNNYGYSAIDLATKNMKDKKTNDEIAVSKVIIGLLQHGKK